MRERAKADLKRFGKTVFEIKVTDCLSAEAFLPFKAGDIGFARVCWRDYNWASVLSIIRLISKEFVVLVAISNVIAWPLGYYLLHKWLQGYAYRSGLGIEIFLMAGFGTLLIALFAVGLHTVKAAWSNPLESIRHE